MRIATVAVAAVLLAAPAYAENVNSTANQAGHLGNRNVAGSGARSYEVERPAENASRSVQIVTVERSTQRPSIVQLPSNGEAAARAPVPVKFERVDEAARARAHAKYEAEKRRWGSPGLAPNARLNEHPLLVESHGSGQSRAEIRWTQTGEGQKSTQESRTAVLERARADINWQGSTAEGWKSAEEARAAVLERTARLNAYEGRNDPTAPGDSAVSDLSDIARARAILSELR